MKTFKTLNTCYTIYLTIIFFFLLANFPCLIYPDTAVKTVVIDPGHGGKDHGATGPSGLKEKEVVLDIALKLKKELESTNKFKVFLTRTKDKFVSLPLRKKIAKLHQPDILISLHCDGNKDRKVKGTSVYILSKRGEKFTVQHSLTEGDYVFNGEYQNNSLAQANNIMSKTTKQSQKLAELTLKHVTAQLGTKQMGVRRAGFKILKVLDVPSILIEVAFISNWWEERQLKKDSFQQKAAIGIRKAILEFTKD